MLEEPADAEGCDCSGHSIFKPLTGSGGSGAANRCVIHTFEILRGKPREFRRVSLRVIRSVQFGSR